MSPGRPQRSVPVVFGEVLFDVYEDGARRLGGAPFNVAWHLQAFGCAPLFVSRVGADADGSDVLARMARWGMRTDGVQVDPAHGTGAVQIRFEGGEPRYDIAADRAWDRITLAQIPLDPGAVLYHGSLALRGEGNRVALAALAGRLGAPRFVDVNLRAPWWSREQVLTALTGARTVKLNEDELDALQPGAGELEDRADALRRDRGVTRVVLTRGAEGAILVDAVGVHAVRPGPTTQVDPVGAGDAFAAVVLLGELHGWDAATTLTRAQAFASRVVAQEGAIAEDPALYPSVRASWDATEGA